jgi:hypothetical protein
MQGGPYHNSPVLNEVHRYFPALLYEGEQFRSMANVFGYVRRQMQNRFDTYSNMRRNYQTSRAPRARVPAVRQPFINRATHAPPQSQSQPQPVIVTEIDNLNNTILGLLNQAEFNRLLNLGLGIPFNTRMEPVIVAPSGTQIEEGSTLHTAIAESDTPCSVCQDVIRETEITRRLTHCGHIFHRNCIDTWYQRNVHCPVCRHDIRQTGAVTP